MRGRIFKTARELDSERRNFEREYNPGWDWSGCEANSETDCDSGGARIKQPYGGDGDAG